MRGDSLIEFERILKHIISSPSASTKHSSNHQPPPWSSAGIVPMRPCVAIDARTTEGVGAYAPSRAAASRRSTRRSRSAFVTAADVAVRTHPASARVSIGTPSADCICDPQMPDRVGIRSRHSSGEGQRRSTDSSTRQRRTRSTTRLRTMQLAAPTRSW